MGGRRRVRRAVVGIVRVACAIRGACCVCIARVVAVPAAQRHRFRCRARRCRDMFRLSAVPNSHGLRIELPGRLDVRGTGAVGLVGVVVRVGDVVGHTRSGLCRGRGLAPVGVIEQRADGDGRWRLGRLGTRRRRGRGLTRECAELVGQPLHLRLELDDFLTIGPVQRIDELADLLHLQPQVRAQHDQIVQTRTHHAAIRRKHRIAVIFVKLAENPREIACRIVDLHVLPVRYRGDGRAGKQHVAIREPAMHRAGDERPQAPPSR